MSLQEQSKTKQNKTKNSYTMLDADNILKLSIRHT